MSEERIAMILGHSRRGDSGAVAADGATSEWSFWKSLLPTIKGQLPENTLVVDSIPRSSYTQAMTWLADLLQAEGVTVAVELHFNAFNGEAMGYEALHYGGSTEGAHLADLLVEEQEERVGPVGNRGAKRIRSMSQRGYQFLRKTPCPAVIWEPFFGDNPAQWDVYGSDYGGRLLASILHRALTEWFAFTGKEWPGDVQQSDGGARINQPLLSIEERLKRLELWAETQGM